MHTIAATAVAIAGSATALGSQVPRSMYLRYTNLRVALSADTSGLYLMANSGEYGTARMTYQGLFKPADALDWVSDARWFLDQKVADTDTGTTRSSSAMIALEDSSRVYLVRRRDGDDWTSERFLVFEPKDHRASPVIVSANELLIREILDSIEVSSRRAPPFKEEVLRDASGAPARFDTPAHVKKGQKPPVYPGAARMQNREGIVVVRFVVGTDGKADMTTARTLLSTDETFRKRVLDWLPKMNFEPATYQGAAVRQLVVMPFDFSLIR